MTTGPDLLRNAATQLRHLAHGALEVGTERWMVDQNEDGGLIVGSYTPDDIDPEGVLSTSTAVVAAFHYTDDDSRAPAAVGPAASHIAALDPRVALALADWLALAGENWGTNNDLDQAALTTARIYLRDDNTGPYSRTSPERE